MATQGGGGGMSGLLQNIAAIAQIRQMQDQLLVQQEQVANQRRQQMISGYGEYLDVVRQAVDPSTVEEVDKAYIEMGFDADALRSLREAVVPTAGVLATDQARKGLATASATDLAAIQLGAATREGTGLTPGGLASDTFIRDNLAASDLSPEVRERLGYATQVRVGAGMDIGSYQRAEAEGSLPRETQQQMALIRGDVSLGASGQSAADTQRMGLELGWANMRSDERIARVSQELQGRGLLIQLEGVKAAQQKGHDPLPMIEQLNAATGKLMDTKVPKTKMEKESLTRTVNSVVAQLTDIGAYEPQGYIIGEIGSDGSVIKQYSLPRQQVEGTQLRPNQKIIGRIPYVMRADDIAAKSAFDYLPGH